MEVRPITSEDYKLILELDKKVYPTHSPVTKEIISKWYSKNPEFGLIYEENKKIVGVCISIPLNKKGWTSLINGGITESELDEKMIFDSSHDKEIGIHIYHIEKLDTNIKKFYKKSLEYLSLLVKSKKAKVFGFSALCKLNCKERDFINTEHILEKGGKLFVFNEKKENINKMIKKGYNYCNRCEMLVLYPNEQSIVWKYF